MQVTWKDLLLDFFVFIVPVIAGIVLLVWDFTPFVLLLVIALLVPGFAGNATVRGKLACGFCCQREIGCPAARLFERKENP